MENDKARKLLIVSEGFPPLLDASAVLINNIFSAYKGEMYAVAGNNFTKFDPAFKAPCKTWYIRFPRNRFTEAFSRRFHHWVLPLYYWYVCYVIRKVRPDVIFNNYPHEVLFVAAYKAAKKYRIPVYAYMHDLWEENMHRPSRKKFAARWEKELLLNADKVICCTSSQQEHYRKKYQVETELVLHPIPDEEAHNIHKATGRSGPVIVGYSGSLSSNMNQDAFVEISNAMSLLPADAELRWFPINRIDPASLESLGIKTEKIRFIYVDRFALAKELAACDILIAPLSHKNCSAEEVKTVFSNKLLGYLVAGRPILVFGPHDCHHAQLARSGGWGYVADKDDPRALAEAILHLKKDKELQEKLVDNAWKEANNRKAGTQADKIYQWVQTQ